MARGVAAGVAGTVVMTAIQLLVEMPITRRAESYARQTWPRSCFRFAAGAVAPDGR